MKTVTIGELHDILQRDRVHFEYKKKDGTLRQAHGTLQIAFIPESLQPKDSQMKREYANFRYFDLDKNAWRSIGSDVAEVRVL